MSWLGNNFSYDFVVSVVTPNITLSPRKPQLGDEKNKDHHFVPTTRSEKKKPEKTQFSELPQRAVGKDTQKNVPTNQMREGGPNNLKLSLKLSSMLKKSLFSLHN